MSSLRELLKSRTENDSSELNLEQGVVIAFSNGNTGSNFMTTNTFFWCPPAAGTAVIEVWGAGGSAARMCCCGTGMPGNAGAYAKKTITVTTNTIICGNIGQSCRNVALCWKGCSDNSGICFVNAGTGSQNGCICAQGGMGGVSICQTSTTSAYCCWIAGGFCGTNYGLNGFCGMICNHQPSSKNWIANAYGGDINCPGPIGCVLFTCCGAGGTNMRCQYFPFVPAPAGKYADGPGHHFYINYGNDDPSAPLNGQGVNNSFHGLNLLSHSPTRGTPFSYCWRSDRNCACYEQYSCVHWMPPGVGAPPVMMCDNHRDNGARGGSGAVKIRFIAD